MRKLGWALSVAILAAGTAAQAQVAGSITNIQSSAGTTFTVSGQATSTVGAGSGTAFVGNPPGPPGTSYNSFVTVGSSAITFESANSGSAANTSSFSQVSFDVTNNLDQAINFKSTITAAGLGFYLADTSGGCLYSCPQATGHTFNELLNGGAHVGFDFSVTGTTDSGTTTLYSLSGGLQMNRDGGLFLFDDLGNADTGPRSVLSNFGAATGNDFTGDISAASGIGYVWDATGISFDLGNNPFETITYKTSVFSNSNASCIANTTICLVAYSGFGDPVGRGGDVTAFASLANFAASLADGPSLTGPNGLITGITFTQTTLDTPTFGPDGVNFGGPGVPEPATWMTLILGFGLLGGTLRRRRTVAAI
jgi:hypothetical protein